MRQGLVRIRWPAVLLGLALTVAVADAAPPTPQVQHAAPERQLYYTRALTDADVKGRSLRELTLMRNWIYARAGNPFRRQWLDAYFREKPWYKPLATMDARKLSQRDRDNADFVAQADAALMRPDLEKRAKSVLKRVKVGTATPEDRIELRLLSARLGRWLGPEDVPAEARSPLEDPRLLEQQVSVTQLADLSRRDLRILRNTIYARRGYPFRSELLTAWFTAFPWYKPVAHFNDRRLTDVDQRNIKLVRSVEDSLGGPMSDQEQAKEDAWFSGA
jgi:hypothetical protein